MSEDPWKAGKDKAKARAESAGKAGAKKAGAKVKGKGKVKKKTAKKVKKQGKFVDGELVIQEIGEKKVKRSTGKGWSEKGKVGQGVGVTGGAGGAKKKKAKGGVSLRVKDKGKAKGDRKKWVAPEMHVLEFGEGVSTPSADFAKAAEGLGVGFEEGDVEKLGRYLFVLLETNTKFNLTAIKEEEAAWMRHILDSLSLLPFLEGSKKVIDVGSGGGLPGIPLAITQPGVHFTLMDSTGKKTRFLEMVVADLGLENVKVMQGRAELVGQDADYRERFDTAIARAIGPMNVLLEYTLPLIEVGGRLLAMKGGRAEEELKACGDGLMMLGGGEVEVYETMPELDDEAVVVVVEKGHATPEEFPRRAGMAKQQPL